MSFFDEEAAIRSSQQQGDSGLWCHAFGCLSCLQARGQVEPATERHPSLKNSMPKLTSARESKVMGSRSNEQGAHLLCSPGGADADAAFGHTSSATHLQAPGLTHTPSTPSWDSNISQPADSAEAAHAGGTGNTQCQDLRLVVAAAEPAGKDVSAHSSCPATPQPGPASHRGQQREERPTVAQGSGFRSGSAEAAAVAIRHCLGSDRPAAAAAGCPTGSKPADKLSPGAQGQVPSAHGCDTKAAAAATAAAASHVPSHASSATRISSHPSFLRPSTTQVLAIKIPAGPTDAPLSRTSNLSPSLPAPAGSGGVQQGGSSLGASPEGATPSPQRQQEQQEHVQEHPVHSPWQALHHPSVGRPPQQRAAAAPVRAGIYSSFVAERELAGLALNQERKTQMYAEEDPSTAARAWARDNGLMCSSGAGSSGLYSESPPLFGRVSNTHVPESPPSAWRVSETSVPEQCLAGPHTSASGIVSRCGIGSASGAIAASVASIRRGAEQEAAAAAVEAPLGGRPSVWSGVQQPADAASGRFVGSSGESLEDRTRSTLHRSDAHYVNYISGHDHLLCAPSPSVRCHSLMGRRPASAQSCPNNSSRTTKYITLEQLREQLAAKRRVDDATAAASDREQGRRAAAAAAAAAALAARRNIELPHREEAFNKNPPHLVAGSRLKNFVVVDCTRSTPMGPESGAHQAIVAGFLPLSPADQAGERLATADLAGNVGPGCPAFATSADLPTSFEQSAAPAAAATAAGTEGGSGGLATDRTLPVAAITASGASGSPFDAAATAASLSWPIACAAAPALPSPVVSTKIAKRSLSKDAPTSARSRGHPAVPLTYTATSPAGGLPFWAANVRPAYPGTAPLASGAALTVLKRTAGVSRVVGGRRVLRRCRTMPPRMMHVAAEAAMAAAGAAGELRVRWEVLHVRLLPHAHPLPLLAGHKQTGAEQLVPPQAAKESTALALVGTASSPGAMTYTGASPPQRSKPRRVLTHSMLLQMRAGVSSSANSNAALVKPWEEEDEEERNLRDATLSLLGRLSDASSSFLVRGGDRATGGLHGSVSGSMRQRCLLAAGILTSSPDTASGPSNMFAAPGSSWGSVLSAVHNRRRLCGSAVHTAIQSAAHSNALVLHVHPPARPDPFAATSSHRSILGDDSSGYSGPIDRLLLASVGENMRASSNGTLGSGDVSDSNLGLHATTATGGSGHTPRMPPPKGPFARLSVDRHLSRSYDPSTAPPGRKGGSGGRGLALFGQTFRDRPSGAFLAVRKAFAVGQPVQSRLS